VSTHPEVDAWLAEKLGIKPGDEVEVRLAGSKCLKPGGAHRDEAAQRAGGCATCTDGVKRALREKPDPCIGCGESIDYFSCAPGYCAMCAHDPCWRSIR